MTDKKKRIEELKEDLRLGKEYEVLALKYETSVDYIKKVYSKMKRDGEELPDRRSSEWRNIQFRRLKDMKPVVGVYSKYKEKEKGN